MNTKNNVGESVLASFKEKLKLSPLQSKSETHAKTTQASNLVIENFQVTMPLVSRGIMERGRNISLLHIFQPNLWVQDFAYEKGDLGMMTIETAIERADASINYKLERSRSLWDHLKKRGKTDEDLRQAMREASLIESAYCTRLGGVGLDKENERKIDVGIALRTVRNNSLFQTVINQGGIDVKDLAAVFQISEELDLTSIIKEVVKNDPYFQRRKTIINEQQTINATKSVRVEYSKSEEFARQIFEKMAKKHPSLFTKVAQSMGK